ncbi:MAG: hypothetical protein V1809_03470 [Planctomycetota bacterium]
MEALRNTNVQETLSKVSLAQQIQSNLQGQDEARKLAEIEARDKQTRAMEDQIRETRKAEGKRIEEKKEPKDEKSKSRRRTPKGQKPVSPSEPPAPQPKVPGEGDNIDIMA